MTREEWINKLREALKEFIVQENDPRFKDLPDPPVGNIFLARTIDITEDVIGYQACSLEEFYNEFREILEDPTIEDKIDEMMRRYPRKGWNKYLEFWKEKGISL